MPASRYIDAYPHYIYIIVESVLLSREEVVIKLESRQQAEKTRRQIYGLRGALLATKEHALSDTASKLTTELTDSTLYVKHIDNAVPAGVIKAAEQVENRE